MYTAKILRKSKDLQLKKVYIDFEYLKDDIQVSTEQKEFHLDITLEQISRYAQNELKRIEAISNNLDLIPVGVKLDLSNVGEYKPTQTEIERDTWLQDWNRLVSAQKLVDHGITLTPQEQNAIQNIKTRLSQNKKIEYLGLI